MSFHTGLDVLDSNTAVYPASGPPSTPVITPAGVAALLRLARSHFGSGNLRLVALSTSTAAGMAAAVEKPASSHYPSDIGEVTLKTRNIFNARSGRPRSKIKKTDPAAAAPKAATRVVRRKGALPAACAPVAKRPDPPAIPPNKKYPPMGHSHGGALTTGLP